MIKPNEIVFQVDYNSDSFDYIPTLTAAFPRLNGDAFNGIYFYPEPAIVVVITDKTVVAQCTSKYGGKNFYESLSGDLAENLNILIDTYGRNSLSRVLIDKDLVPYAFSNRGFVDLHLIPDYDYSIPLGFKNLLGQVENDRKWIYWGFCGYLLRSIKTYMYDLTTLLILQSMTFKTISGFKRSNDKKQLTVPAFLFYYQYAIKHSLVMDKIYKDTDFRDFYGKISDYFMKFLTLGVIKPYSTIVSDEIIGSLDFSEEFLELISSFEQSKETKITPNLGTRNIDPLDLITNFSKHVKETTNIFSNWNETFYILIEHGIKLNRDLINYMFVVPEEKQVTVVVNNNTDKKVVIPTIARYFYEKFSPSGYSTKVMEVGELRG